MSDEKRPALPEPHVRILRQVNIPDTRAAVMMDVSEERDRQERLKYEGRFKFTCADSEMSLAEKMTVIGEEYGESCRATLEATALSEDRNFYNAREQLRTELVQLAACAVAAIECIDREDRRSTRMPTIPYPIGKR
jgi:hypothetical protein